MFDETNRVVNFLNSLQIKVILGYLLNLKLSQNDKYAGQAKNNNMKSSKRLRQNPRPSRPTELPDGVNEWRETQWRTPENSNLILKSYYW